MKIFHLTDHLPGFHDTWGGAEQVAYRYIKLLEDSNKAEIIVGSVKPDKKVKENFRFIRIFVLEDLFPKRFHIYITGIKNRILSFDLISFINLLFILAKEKPDIIHIHKANQISFSAILAAKIFRIKIILAMYDYWYLCPGGMLIDDKGNLCERMHGEWCKNCTAVTDFRFLLPVTSIFRRPIFDFLYRFVDAFIVLSNSQKKILENYGIARQKIFLVRQVFNFEKKSRVNKIQKHLIVFTGWLDPRKGLHILVEAMPKVIKEFPDAKMAVLELSGIKGYKEKILNRIEELGIGEKIIFYGRLPREKFNRLISAADAIVVPEQWENMSPVIIIEAMINGKTIIASRVGGIPEFINDKVNGLLTERNNPPDWAEKIIWAFKNPEKADQLGKQAQKDIIKICDQGKILKNLLELYSKL